MGGTYLYQGEEPTDFKKGVGRAQLLAIPRYGSIPFYFASGGLYRTATWSVSVEADHFTELAQAMMKAAPVEAIRAFGAALQVYEAEPNQEVL
jgi:hypothetical protein